MPVTTGGWCSLTVAGTMYTVAKGPTVIVQKTRRGEAGPGYLSVGWEIVFSGESS